MTGIDGFEYRTVGVGPTTYRPGIAGSGPAVLLLHGFPQTHYCWRQVAPALTAQNSVVVCDLKGYGESRAAPGGALGEGYSKRELAAELVELMARLGFERFAVVGHDRGGRVAYRMSLDHADIVERLVVLNIVPTVDQFERMAADAALDYYPWFLLAQPAPFPERLIGASAEYFLRHVLDTWVASPGAIPAEAGERYLRAFTPEVIAAMCADYRAAFHIDRITDAEDRQAGRRIGCPVLVHWGAEEGSMSDGPLRVWRSWAESVEGGPLRSGHFIPEEAPGELVASLRGFLRGAERDTVHSMSDTELKARHRAMWASGDYPSMVETFLLPLGPRLVEACGIGPGMRVLDVASGTGNAAIPAAERGATVTASDLTPELLEAGRARAEAEGLELEWVEADAENLPFGDESFDVVMSSIGAMFAPHHQEVADELVRVCRPGGTIGMLNWTPEGMIGALFRTMGPFAPPPPPGASPPPLWGGEDHVRELFGDRVDFHTLERDVLEITAFDRPHDYATHFKERYGPTIAAQNNARANGREAELEEALDAFTEEWNRGTDDNARFEKEYLIAVGTRA